jgi:hypothetical protein
LRLSFPFELNFGLFAGLQNRVFKLSNRALASAFKKPNLGLRSANILKDKFVRAFGACHHQAKVEFLAVQDLDSPEFAIRGSINHILQRLLVGGLRNQKLFDSKKMNLTLVSDIVLILCQPESDA